MNKRTHNRKAGQEMRSQYDFSKGKRSSHAQEYAKGHEVRIDRADGTVTVQRFAQSGQHIQGG